LIGLRFRLSEAEGIKKRWIELIDNLPNGIWLIGEIFGAHGNTVLNSIAVLGPVG
jgi:hypothetical protein